MGGGKRMKNVKTRRAVTMMSLLVAISLVGMACSSGGDSGQSSNDASAAPSGSVSLFGFEDAVLPSIVAEFEKAYPNVHVQTATMSSNDEAITKLQAGFQADVLHICTSDTARMVKLGLIQPIDTSRLADWKDVYPTFQNLPGTHVDGKLYMMPFEGGHSGIVYNPTQVSTPLTSYRQLFEDPELAGKVTLETSGGAGVTNTGSALTISCAETTLASPGATTSPASSTRVACITPVAPRAARAIAGSLPASALRAAAWPPRRRGGRAARRSS